MDKVSINLPEDVAKELAWLAPDVSARAEIIEHALRAYLNFPSQSRDDSDLLNRHAEELNSEAEDVLDFQYLR